MANVYQGKMFGQWATPVGAFAVPTNKVIASNICTLTFASNHNITLGSVIRVAGVDATIDGIHVVATVPSGTTLTFATSTATLATASCAGSVEVLSTNGGIAVSTFIAVNGTVTLATSAVHGRAVDDLVYVNVGDTSIDGICRVIAVPLSTSMLVVPMTGVSTYSVASVTRAGAVGLLIANAPTAQKLYEVPASLFAQAPGLWVLNSDRAEWPYAVWVSPDASLANAERITPIGETLTPGQAELMLTGAILQEAVKVYVAGGGPRMTFTLWGIEQTAAVAS